VVVGLAPGINSNVRIVCSPPQITRMHISQQTYVQEVTQSENKRYTLGKALILASHYLVLMFCILAGKIGSAKSRPIMIFEISGFAHWKQTASSFATSSLKNKSKQKIALKRFVFLNLILVLWNQTGNNGTRYYVVIWKIARITLLYFTYGCWCHDPSLCLCM
jgi:hypothetical protein